MGGAPPALWQGAAPLEDVRRRLAALLAGRILVGHHLRKDLAALALAHPPEATRDTLQYRWVGLCLAAVAGAACLRVGLVGLTVCLIAQRVSQPCWCYQGVRSRTTCYSHPPSCALPASPDRELQGRRGSGRKLRDLSAEKLGRTIQHSGRRHSPRFAVGWWACSLLNSRCFGARAVYVVRVPSMCPLACIPEAPPCSALLHPFPPTSMSREDAQAAMDLYLRYVHFEERHWQYGDLVERHLADILASADILTAASVSSVGDSVGGSTIGDDSGSDEDGMDGGGDSRR